MLRSVLGNDITISVRKKPYPHIVVDNLFKKNFCQILRESFNERLSEGFSKTYNLSKFWKFNHYDAYCWSFLPERDQVFTDLFYSPEWQKWVNNFFELELTPNVMGELHHHLVGSKSGYVHNDYDLATFIKEPLPTGINPFRHNATYRGRNNHPNAVHCVRSVACLYYFNNQPWQGGGETGLYANHADAAPARAVEPFNNRLLAFEISPKSWHSFMTNNKEARNAMAFWLHSDENYMKERYGEEAK